MPHPLPPQVGAPSPWGPTETVRALSAEAVVATTASYGSRRRSPAAFAPLPLAPCKTCFSADGWFEEDCDWVRPNLALELHRFESSAAKGAAGRARARRLVGRAQAADQQSLTAEPGRGGGQ